MKQLADQGMSVMLDDFGAGFSSLSYVHQYHFSGLKIDKSFILGLASSVRSRAIVRAIVPHGRIAGPDRGGRRRRGTWKPWSCCARSAQGRHRVTIFRHRCLLSNCTFPAASFKPEAFRLPLAAAPGGNAWLFFDGGWPDVFRRRHVNQQVRHLTRTWHWTCF